MNKILNVLFLIAYLIATVVLIFQVVYTIKMLGSKSESFDADRDPVPTSPEVKNSVVSFDHNQEVDKANIKIESDVKPLNNENDEKQNPKSKRTASKSVDN